MMVWRVRSTGPVQLSVRSAAPGAGTMGMSLSVTTFMCVLPCCCYRTGAGIASRVTSWIFNPNAAISAASMPSAASPYSPPA